MRSERYRENDREYSEGRQPEMVVDESCQQRPKDEFAATAERVGRVLRAAAVSARRAQRRTIRRCQEPRVLRP